MFKCWDVTKRISLTPSLNFIYKLRAGDVEENNVGFVELNRSSINAKYLNKFGNRWGPALQDHEQLNLQWKG